MMIVSFRVWLARLLFKWGTAIHPAKKREGNKITMYT